MPTKPTLLLDPNHEPVRAVDRITLHETSGLHHDMTLCTCTYVPRADGGFDHAPVVAARIRFSHEMARAIVTGLTQQLAMLEMRGKPQN